MVAAKPNVKDLKLAYEGLLTPSATNRIAALAGALAWVDAALPYAVQKKLITPDMIKPMERAVKCRKQGIGTTIEGEKEAAFQMAMKQYEIVFAKLHVPSIAEYYKRYEEQKPALEAKALALEAKFGNVIQLLKDALGTPLSLKVIPNAPKDRQMNPACNELVYSKNAAIGMADTLKREGLLTLVARELKVLSRAECIESDGNGGYTVNAAKQLEVMIVRMDHLAIYCRQNPDAQRSLIRNRPAPGQAQAPVNGNPQAPKPAIQRAPRVPGANALPKIGGWYRAGSALALAYQGLEDGAWHEINDVIAGSPAANPRWGFEQLIKDGKTRGWTITVQGTKAQMIVAKP